MPDVSRPYLNYGIIRSAGHGGHKAWVGDLAYFIPKGEVEIDVIGDDGLPTGKKLVAVHVDAITATRPIETEASREAILRPKAIAPDREAEAAAKARVEAE